MRTAHAGRETLRTGPAASPATRETSSSGSPKGMPPWVSTGEPKVTRLAMPSERRYAAVW